MLIDDERLRDGATDLGRESSPPPTDASTRPTRPDCVSLSVALPTRGKDSFALVALISVSLIHVKVELCRPNNVRINS